jgi:hypothetical protein
MSALRPGFGCGFFGAKRRLVPCSQLEQDVETFLRREPHVIVPFGLLGALEALVYLNDSFHGFASLSTN